MSWDANAGDELGEVMACGGRGEIHRWLSLEKVPISSLDSLSLFLSNLSP